MFTRHDRFKKKNNKNTYNYYDSRHDRSYGRTDEVNLLTAPSFLSQFKPKHDGKRFRTTSQLEPDTYCDFVAEVIIMTGKQTGNKVTMILTDYTEHEELPHQNEDGRPIGKASIITTLWDEHYQTAVDKGIRKGDLIRLRNLRAKTDLTRKIELNMNGYRGFGYQQGFPITKLDPSDTDVKELLSRKALYEQHLTAQEEKRTRRYVSLPRQRQPTPTKQEPKRPRPPLPSRTPPMRRPYDPNHPLHLPIYPEGYVRSPTTSGTRSPTHGIEPFEYPTFKRNPSLLHSSSSKEGEDENELLAPPRPVRVPGSPIGSFASLSTTRSPSQDIQPVVDTLSDREFIFPSKEDDGDDDGVQEDDELEPIQELSTPSVFPDATATTKTTRSSSQDIQPVVVDVPSVRQSIIVIDDNEDEEDEVLLVPTPRRLLSAEETASTTRSPSQDFRLLPHTPLERDPTPLERNPSLPVERESSRREFSIPVAPDFQCLRSPIPLINTSSTRSSKRETTPLVAVKLELNSVASSPTLSSVSAQRWSAATPFGVSPTVPAPRCPSCKHDGGVEFKYDFKLKLMDEFGQEYIVKVDDTHATALIGILAGDLMNDCEKLEKILGTQRDLIE
ncbi:hypothetical protein KI688_005897 [Linnemannia hyalina]|uniref:Protection of telomeres protein 1 ssDNA-binding domain-containing protein n=1 Tax=Linnemannia hyalina TaxID=64524 RepID=A0A9P7Y551_9FUNG|nr:hypothetical protein KI688_005897 [Linnemannia hyalina]